MPTQPPDWSGGQLLRIKHHRFLFIEGEGEVSVAVGVYDLEHGWFKVTHPLGHEPPQIGEQMMLLKGLPPNSPEEMVWITGVEHHADTGNQVIYSFRREGS